MKAVVAAFNQEKALVGAFSVITNLRMELGWNFLKHYQVDSEAALVIPTGGDPARAGVTEAAVMARLLAEAGVAAARIVQEPRARTTAENAIYVLQLVAARLEAAEAGSEVRVVVVTSAYHLPLALWMFRQAASVLPLRVSVSASKSSIRSKSEGS